jgi:hypothetical protein
VISANAPFFPREQPGVHIHCRQPGQQRESFRLAFDAQTMASTKFRRIWLVEQFRNRKTAFSFVNTHGCSSATDKSKRTSNRLPQSDETLTYSRHPVVFHKTEHASG